MITLLRIIHVSACLFLMVVVLLQQGKGGGMGAAFGGGAAQQVFGGRGAGNVLTRATAIFATVFMLTSVSLAYFSSAGDRSLRERAQAEQKKGKGNEGTPRAPAPKTEGAAGGATPPTDKPADKPTETPATNPTPAPVPSN